MERRVEGEMEVAISDVMFGANDPPMLITETVHSTRVLVNIRTPPAQDYMALPVDECMVFFGGLAVSAVGSVVDPSMQCSAVVLY